MSNKNKHILIVDSSIISANRIFNALSEVTNILKVDYAANGNEALQKINDSQPNAIMLDIQLPDISGSDILRKIKLFYPGVAVIVLTDYPTSFSLKLCKELGAIGYYNKSMELNMAIEQLQQLTNKF